MPAPTPAFILTCHDCPAPKVALQTTTATIVFAQPDVCLSCPRHPHLNAEAK